MVFRFSLMTALLVGCGSVSATDIATLPDAAQIQQAFQQAIAPDLANAEASGDVMAIALLSSIRVEKALGCVPADEAQLRCIVSMSGGMRQDQHRVLALQRQWHGWRLIPTDEDNSPPPAPSLVQAQQAMRDHAAAALAKGETAAEWQQAAVGLTVQDLRDCNLDERHGHVSCSLDVRISASAAPIASTVDFRLDGSRWRMEDNR